MTFLDLSGNRITVLPVELRFMTTVVHLNLEENPLSCPPANVSKESSCQERPLAHRNRINFAFLSRPIPDLRLVDGSLVFQLCSRGRVHVFKYLEIQAVKEDRKRGVLTEQEYRRSSYRKAAAAAAAGSGAQLGDLRFANGFCNGDARRKRHTADSGYGSEQPLDRRWSQEFAQEVSEILACALFRSFPYYHESR